MWYLGSIGAVSKVYGGNTKENIGLGKIIGGGGVRSVAMG
jgi:hypothetical protein